uniref:Large terminase n=2 Tax=root TaxID=1 RepID=A0A8S5SCA3_9CAUD|nr:MAG TPA: large terminase [Siphoviridae sp. ctqBc4]
MAGLPGINLILGVSLGNIERNVLTPMRDRFGDAMVGGIRGTENTATLFGEKVYCLGAEKRSQVSKLKGAEVKFCYCDELADISEDVFEMLKSRLSLTYSECHAACNPASPRHWLKRFLDTDGLDVYDQHYTIDDNPHLPRSYVDELRREYAGTVYYDRYILGRWTQAEGLIYPDFEHAMEDDWHGEAVREVVSMDYGTLNATAALRWQLDAEGIWHVVGEYYHSGRDTQRQKTDAEYVEDMRAFAPGAELFVIDPSAASFIAAMRSAGMRVRPARNEVLDGIRHVATAMREGTVRIGTGCKCLADELAGYVWDERAEVDRPVKVADHACDALRYGVETMRMYNRERPYRSLLDGSDYR